MAAIRSPYIFEFWAVPSTPSRGLLNDLPYRSAKERIIRALAKQLAKQGRQWNKEGINTVYVSGYWISLIPDDLDDWAIEATIDTNDPWLVGFSVNTTVPLLALTGSFTTRAGSSMGLMTGARSVSRNWARGFYDAYPNRGGLYYPASMHANRPAMVLTDRAERVIPDHPRLHRALCDPALLTVLRNAARALGYALN